MHLNAIGGIIRSSIYTKKPIYILSAVRDTKEKDAECVSISDFVTEKCRTIDIVYWLFSVKTGISPKGMDVLSNQRIGCAKGITVVTDMS